MTSVPRPVSGYLVVHRVGRRVTVRVTERTWNLDGELVASPSPLQWQVQPGAWQVVA